MAWCSDTPKLRIDGKIHFKLRSFPFPRGKIEQLWGSESRRQQTQCQSKSRHSLTVGFDGRLVSGDGVIRSARLFHQATPSVPVDYIVSRILTAREAKMRTEEVAMVPCSISISRLTMAQKTRLPYFNRRNSVFGMRSMRSPEFPFLI